MPSMLTTPTIAIVSPLHLSACISSRFSFLIEIMLYLYVHEYGSIPMVLPHYVRTYTRKRTREYHGTVYHIYGTVPWYVHVYHGTSGTYTCTYVYHSMVLQYYSVVGASSNV
jgi:hypothetical protein